MTRFVWAWLVSVMVAPASLADSSDVRQPTPMPLPLPAPTQETFRGLIELHVDATDLQRKIFRARQRIPVQAAERITLLYPMWMPGNHAPRGPLENLAGLKFSVDGREVPWERDPVNMAAFHIDLPAGAQYLDTQLQYLSPTTPEQGRVVLSSAIAHVQWNTVLLYPAGHDARRIRIQASLELPEHWSHSTALALEGATEDGLRFQPVSLATLVDSPVFAGQHVRRIELDDGQHPVTLNVVADSAELLRASEAQIEAHRRLLRQTDRLFGWRPFDRYDFLLALSDRIGGIGLEHARSSENATRPGYFSEWDKLASTRFLLPHEYVHAWNGKQRRPADLWIADFNTPMRGSLLWVYEGLTHYWQTVLAARAGLVTREQAIDALAVTAAVYAHRPGREWRSLSDTTNKPILVSRRPAPWPDWQRGVLDFYEESALLWLDVDTIIREQSDGRRSLDDFARTFFPPNGEPDAISLYTIDDVIGALARVQSYEWREYLKERLEGRSDAALDGLRRGGYELVYTERPSTYFAELESFSGNTDLTHALGLVLSGSGGIQAVRWGSPAFEAGLTKGAQVLAVDGRAYSAKRLKAAIGAAREDGTELALLVRSGDEFRTHTIEYHDGLRYPHLQRIPATRAWLDEILAPR